MVSTVKIKEKLVLTNEQINALLSLVEKEVNGYWYKVDKDKILPALIHLFKSIGIDNYNIENITNISDINQFLADLWKLEKEVIKTREQVRKAITDSKDERYIKAEKIYIIVWTVLKYFTTLIEKETSRQRFGDISKVDIKIDPDKILFIDSKTIRQARQLIESITNWYSLKDIKVVKTEYKGQPLYKIQNTDGQYIILWNVRNVNLSIK